MGDRPDGNGSGGSARSIDRRQQSRSRGAAVLILLRPLNCLIAAVGVAAGLIVAVGAAFLEPWLLPRLLLGTVAVFVVTAGGNALNDVIDAESDRLNHPTRPLPAGELALPAARALAVLLFAAGAVCGALVSGLQFLVTLLAIGLLVLYELVLKHRGLVGNCCVALLTALVFVYGGLLAQTVLLPAANGGLLATGLLGACAFCATLGREIVKDVEDLAGDADRVTLPKRVGTRAATVTGAAALLAGIVLSPLAWQPLRILGPLYFAIVLVADTVFVGAVVVAFRSPHRAQQLIKLGMMIAMVAFIAGRFW